MILQKQSSNVQYVEENILVVKREILLGDDAWHGLRVIENFDDYLTVVRQHQEFHPRSIMENDPSYKQIIPYLIFSYNQQYFLMQRQAQATEQRLQNKYSLGIGGHIRQEDITQGDIIEWARREFEEEISYTGTLAIKPIGVLNDDSNDVGKVHIGFVFLLEGSTNQIAVKSELKSGILYTLEECSSFFEHMENWSQIVLQHLKELNKLGSE